MSGKTRLEAPHDHLETLRKKTTYLLFGHSVGFVGCLFVARDHPDRAAPFDHLDFLMLLFGCGLLLGALIWSSLMTVNIGLVPPNSSGPRRLPAKVIECLAFFYVWSSRIALGASVVLMMYSFCGYLLRRWFVFFTPSFT